MMMWRVMTLGGEGVVGNRSGRASEQNRKKLEDEYQTHFKWF